MQSNISTMQQTQTAQHQLKQLKLLSEFHTNIPYIEMQVSKIHNFTSLVKYLIHYLQKQHINKTIQGQISPYVIYVDNDAKLNGCNNNKNNTKIINNNNNNNKHFNFQIILTNMPKYINFDCIIQMQFSNIQLHNCEFLQFIHLPSLKQLIFQGSNITNFKSIQKIQLPSLNFFNFSNNQARELNLSRHKFYQPLKYLAFQQYGHHPSVCQNLSLMAKIQTNNLQVIWITSYQMIKQWKTLKVMQQKFTKANFYKHAYWFAS